MRIKFFFSNETALSIVQDTLLFLIFISISAMILSPVILHSPSYYSIVHQRSEDQVDEVLQTLLATTKQYSYKTGATISNPLAESIGLNTSNSEGIYSLLTTHFLGKEQYHKTIGQLISEQLTTQYQLTINKTTFYLNPFSGNSETELHHLITSELDCLLSPNIHFNLSAIWRPIRHIPFGGKINIGDPVPETTSTYISSQTLSLPLLPCITINNRTFCFSSYHFKKEAKVLIENIPSLENISLLQNKTMNLTKSNITRNLEQNISSLIEGFFIHGIYSQEDSLLFPSIFDVLFSFIFSPSSFSLNQQTKSDNRFSPSFECLDSISHSNYVKKSEGNILPSSSSIISNFGKSIENQVDNVLLTSSTHFVEFIKDSITPLVQSHICSISQMLSTKMISYNQTVLSIFNNVIDIIFSYLSLSRASISLTIWRV